MLARPADYEALCSAEHLLVKSIKLCLPNVICVTRGSVKLKDALAIRLTGKLDLDCYLILPRNNTQAMCRLVLESLTSLCCIQRWSIQIRELGYRIRIQDQPRLSLDIGLLTSNNSLTERLTTDGHNIGNTDVLTPKLANSQAFKDPRLYSNWLNLKCWSINHLPWSALPSTHVLRSFVLLHDRVSNHLTDTGWVGYKQWVSALLEHIESGDIVKRYNRIEPLANSMEKTIQPFSNSLSNYVDQLSDITFDEHRKEVVSRQANKSVRVFLSSRQREFQKLRQNINEKAPTGFKMLLSENFFPWELRIENGIDVCEAAVASADIFVGIYGNEYGIASQGRSGSPIEEELVQARALIAPEKIFLFRLPNCQPEPKLLRLLRKNSDLGTQRIHEDIDLATKQILSKLIRSLHVDPVQPGFPNFQCKNETNNLGQVRINTYLANG